MLKFLNISGKEGVLMEDVFSEELGIHIGIVNIYGPCHNHVAFWEDVMGSSFM